MLAAGARSAKIQRPPFRLGCLQASAQMATREFSADRDTKATPREPTPRETAGTPGFIAYFHTVPLAAIGHMQELYARGGLKQLQREMGNAAGAGRAEGDRAGPLCRPRPPPPCGTPPRGRGCP